MEELDLKELFSLFLSKMFQIILIVIIAAGAGLIYTIGFTTPKYTSGTKLVLTGSDSSASDKSITTTDVTLNSKLVSTYSEIVKSTSVVQQVISNLNLDISESALKKSISVKATEGTEVIQISVTNEDPQVAAKIANEIAIVFCNKITELYGINNIRILDTAVESATPSNINHTKDIAMFTFLGIVIAVGYVLIANMLDTTIKSAEDIEKGFSLPVLVSIPLIDSFSNEKGGKK